MKLLKFHLRYHPPGITLEYVKKGIVKSKDIDLLDLNCNTDLKQMANQMQLEEPLITDEVRGQLEQCLETLRKRIEHEGPTGKRYYIHKTLVTHVLPLTNVAFDKAGSRCLTGSYDRTCKIWDVEEGSEIRTLSGHQNVVYSVAYNYPICDLLVTGSFDKSARVWRAETGECVSTLWGHSGEVVSAQFAPKGDHLATASMDYTAKLYDTLTGTEIHTYTGHTAEVIALQFDPNEGQRLITGSFDGTISMWDNRTKSRVAVLTGHMAEISNVLYNWDSSLVASSSLDGSARLWDARGRDCIATVTADAAEMLDVCFDWAGRRLATAGSDGTARVYQANTDCRQLTTMRGHSEEISKVCFSPAGGCLLTASADKTARIWSSTTGNCIQVCSYGSTAAEYYISFGLQVLSGHQGEIFSCAFSYAGDTIVTASKDNTCRVWR